MAWLIGQRSRIQGRIDRWKGQLDGLPEKIKAAKAELAALDAVVPLHEVQVDPQKIKGRRPHGPRTGQSGQWSLQTEEQLGENDANRKEPTTHGS